MIPKNEKKKREIILKKNTVGKRKRYFPLNAYFDVGILEFCDG